MAALAAAMTACVFAIPTDGLSGGATDAAAAPDTPVDAPAISGDSGDAGTSSLLDAADAADARFPADAVVWPGNGHGYAVRVVASGVTWEKARLLAEAAGGHLVTIGSQAENSFVIALMDSHLSDAFNVDGVGPWMGGLQPSPTDAGEPADGWKWLDGTPWTFTDWLPPYQPDNTNGVENYLGVYRPGGVTGWNDNALNGTRSPVMSYLVEFD